MSTAVRGRPRRARAHGALDRHRCWVMCWVYLYVTGTARTSTTRNREKLLIYLPHKTTKIDPLRRLTHRPSQTAEPDTPRLRADVAPGAGGGDPHRPGFRDERISEFGNIPKRRVWVREARDWPIGPVSARECLRGYTVSATPSPQGNHSLGAGAPCARGCSAKGARSHGQSFPLACATLRLNESKYSCGRLCMRT